MGLTEGFGAAPVQHGDIGLYTWDPVQSILTWDAAAAVIFQARPGETPMQTWLRRAHPEDQSRVLSTFSTLDHAEALYRLVMDDGSIRHVLARTTGTTRAQDGSVSAVGVFLDVTGSVQSSQRLESMLDNISDGFCTLDREFRFTYVNRSGETVLGMPEQSLLGRTLWEVFPHTVGSRFEVAYRKVMDQDVAVTLEEYYPDPLNMWLEVRAQPSDDGIVIYFQDVTERRGRQDERDRLLAAERRARLEAERAQAELSYQASHDLLTGLANRSALEGFARGHLERSSVTALFIDLDRFKLVNDSLGHAAGDALLVEVGRRIAAAVSPGALAARIGGDEFVVLLPDTEAAEALCDAQRLLEAMRPPVQIDGATVSCTASIGLAAVPPGTSVNDLLRDADIALYRAKDGGRDTCAWFDADSFQQLLCRISLEQDLRRAIIDGEIEQHYQPIFNLANGDVVGVEALARWRHPTRGWVSPDVFIPLIEEIGLMGQFGETVMRTAVDEASRWLALPDFTVWFNLSGRQLDRPGFGRRLLELLAQEHVPPHRVGVEVTETIVLDRQAATAELHVLADAGVPLAIDDFGTGHSSLARLIDLPIDVLKIDRSFVARACTEKGRAAIDVIVHLAARLGMTTVAEGVEHAEQVTLMRHAGADLAAGFHLTPPMTAEALCELLGQGEPAATQISA